jgi:hypothetical protein
MELRCSKKGLATMSKKRKPAKAKRNLRTQALADIKKAQQSIEKLELDLKRVKDDISNMDHMPHCPSPKYSGGR